LVSLAAAIASSMLHVRLQQAVTCFLLQILDP
jgi:hypothetical protein